MNLVEALNDGWGWTGIEAAEIHAQSPMGHLLFSDVDGCFHYLDTDGMKLLALGNEEAAKTHFDMDETRQIWLATPLVEAARERLGNPPEGWVFALRPDAMIEGDYSPDGICLLPLEELIRLSGDIARQIKDLPDRATIQFKVID